jgi:hypothetical protein
VLKLEVCFVLFFAGFKLGSPSFLGILRAVPDNFSLRTNQHQLSATSQTNMRVANGKKKLGKKP